MASEWAGSAAGVVLCKPLASAAFVGAALAAGAPATFYGALVLIALILSWLGDVLLIPTRHPRLLLAGMASFLLAHITYGLAFWLRGPEPWTLAITVPVVGVAAYSVARWLGPRLSGLFRLAVPAYLAAISTMVILAASVVGRSFGVATAAGALLFAASDILVARDRFIRPGWHNRALGLPLYYAAQLLLASTASHG